jgi:hypothetical protein
MIYFCPECGRPTMMRAVRLVAFQPRGRLTAWALGPVREVLLGYHAICATPGCNTLVRVDAEGMRRLKPREAREPQQDAIPPAPEPPRPPMQIHRTPGMVWTREGR